VQVVVELVGSNKGELANAAFANLCDHIDLTISMFLVLHPPVIALSPAPVTRAACSNETLAGFFTSADWEYENVQ
jgi:hypothetical protein